MTIDRESADTWGLVDTLLDSWEHSLLDVLRVQERMERERQQGWQTGDIAEYVPPCSTVAVPAMLWRAP